jgi:RND family efflux transporter MFP subunit
LVAVAAALMGVLLWTLLPRAEDGEAQPEVGGAPAGRPALTVTLTAPEPAEWPQLIAAYGNVAPWQEAVIGSELSGYRLTEVLVNVGDLVTQGQLLARLASDTVGAELAQSRAAVEEAEARLAEARADADRARRVEERGALSAQQINQLLTGEQTALARVHAAQAKVQADELRVSQTRILAPDDGVISARTATVGSLAQHGEELFRLIRGGRLEWRAEVTAAELARVSPGMAASLVPPGAPAEALVRGLVRMVAPTLDPQTRNALVYVDLPADGPLRAGMFVRGEIQVGEGAGPDPAPGGGGAARWLRLRLSQSAPTAGSARSRWSWAAAWASGSRSRAASPPRCAWSSPAPASSPTATWCGWSRRRRRAWRRPGSPPHPPEAPPWPSTSPPGRSATRPRRCCCSSC